MLRYWVEEMRRDPGYCAMYCVVSLFWRSARVVMLPFILADRMKEKGKKTPEPLPANVVSLEERRIRREMDKYRVA